MLSLNVASSIYLCVCVCVWSGYVDIYTPKMNSYLLQTSSCLCDSCNSHSPLQKQRPAAIDLVMLLLLQPHWTAV